MIKDNGGDAFPSPGVVIDYDKNEHQQGAHGGMSLRDYFAANAQAGMLANYNVINTPEHVAQMAYAHADAMLAERSKS